MRPMTANAMFHKIDQLIRALHTEQSCVLLLLEYDGVRAKAVPASLNGSYAEARGLTVEEALSALMAKLADHARDRAEQLDGKRAKLAAALADDSERT